MNDLKNATKMLSKSGVTAVPIGKSIALNFYIRKQKTFEIYDLQFHIKKLEKEQNM